MPREAAGEMIQAAPDGGMLEAGWGGKQNLNQNLHRMFHFRVIINQKQTKCQVSLEYYSPGHEATFHCFSA